MIKRAVVVGGAGAVGELFARHLLDTGAEVTVVDTVRPAAPFRHVPGDVTAVDFRLAAELGHADLVVLALPEPVALAALHGVVAELRPDALLVDTLSVKQLITRAVRELAPEIQAVGLNPMFAPSLGFEGRPVAAVVVNEGPRTEELLKLVGSWGATVVRVDAAEHDRLAGATQVLTHAAVLGFGLALSGLGVPAARLRQVAPPPATTLLALLARIASGTPEVYWDVQHANPEAADVRTALADSLRRLVAIVEQGDEADFTAALTELRAYLGEDLARHRDTCARLFEQI
ncbi:prephenate dehydrogenase/arogenate dehydrogenase family protein [Streptomyces sp. NPDC059168]|uniref:prephenate dehydrogenase/arogenate dehydrogenase family protein n=1 Tax=Streptomyces sp. NPDC059168 TaxID=3346753 RepID=UPI0036A7F68A